MNYTLPPFFTLRLFPSLTAQDAADKSEAIHMLLIPDPTANIVSH